MFRTFTVRNCKCQSNDVRDKLLSIIEAGCGTLDNFDALVSRDESALWVVEYYADWCGHCKAFKKGFEKAATNLEGLVKFGAVNAENNPSTTQAAGVQGYPSIKIYMPEATRNPYTGKIFKPAETYQGPRSARGMVDAATAAALISPPPDACSVNIFTPRRAASTLANAVVFGMS